MLGPKPTLEPGVIFHDSHPWNQSAFVPMHEVGYIDLPRYLYLSFYLHDHVMYRFGMGQVSTPLDFMLRPLGEDEVYTIMPTTLEPGKRGSFFLSVVTEADFILRRDTLGGSITHNPPSGSNSTHRQHGRGGGRR